MGLILTVDVGNSNIVIAGMQEGSVVFLDRLPTAFHWDRAELQQRLSALLQRQGRNAGDIDGGILSSVVPQLNAPLQEAFRELTGKPLPRAEAHIPLQGYFGKEPGMDRRVDLAAAREMFGAPVAVFDLGSCTTLSVMNREGAFMGGMILPGIQMALDAEAERTAQLPALRATPPQALLGHDTASCMQNGAVIGTAAMIDGIRERLEEEMAQELFGAPLTVVLTGGLGKLVLPWLRREVQYVPELLLKGLEILYYREISNPSLDPSGNPSCNPACDPS